MKIRSEVLAIPVFIAELDKSETAAANITDIVTHYRAAIERHPLARYIGLFDHYHHTLALPDGEIAEDILDAKNIVVCFGVSLPGPEVMAMRPRSIGITELGDRFVITFLEPPMPVANSALEAWTKALIAEEAMPHPAKNDATDGTGEADDVV